MLDSHLQLLTIELSLESTSSESSRSLAGIAPSRLALDTALECVQVGPRKDFNELQIRASNEQRISTKA